MIDAVTAATCNPPFQLVDRPLVIEQVDATRIDERKQVLVEVALRLLRQLVVHAVTAKHLPAPLSSVAVAPNLRDPVRLQELRERATPRPPTRYAASGSAISGCALKKMAAQRLGRPRGASDVSPEGRSLMCGCA